MVVLKDAQNSVDCFIKKKHRSSCTLIKRRNTAYLRHTFRIIKYQPLNLFLEGKIKEKRGIGRKYSWLMNIRDWTRLNAYALFRAVQNKEEYFVLNRLAVQ